VLTDVDGVRVGHWTDPIARTGCTVALFPAGTVASGEVRGGAPATREVALLEPWRAVARLDAVVLTGGSAFGLASADGVMRFCEERGMGIPTRGGPVPIVVAFALFDLTVGDGRVRPDAAAGYAACGGAVGGAFEIGSVGAGTGATVGKWRGSEHRRPGGLGTATVRRGDLVVSALVAVNAVGEAPGADADVRVPDMAGPLVASTTIGVIATNASLSKLDCFLVAQSGHDGLARALVPAHTRADGDALVAAATGGVHATVDAVRELAAAAVERAIRPVA
jgi:L-aminopeptidase/D-esterase-like protein